VTQVEGFFDYLPPIFGEIFAGNMVAGVFVVGLIMELLLPHDAAKYEAYVEHGLDGIDLDPALLHDQNEEQK
jgi:hypothetical protein